MNAPDRWCSTSRPLFAAFALTGLAGLSLLASACGGPASPRVVALDTTTTSSTTTAPSTSGTSAGAKELAFARCMRSHGVPNFPDPDPQGNFPPFNTDVSKQTSTVANEACKKLLPSGGGGSAGTRGDRQKLAFALTVARCMRSHGFPTYPDPTAPGSASQGSGIRFDGTGIDPRSPKFQSAENNCEKHARQALGLP
jgi:hypothetical protein